VCAVWVYWVCLVWVLCGVYVVCTGCVWHVVVRVCCVGSEHTMMSVRSHWLKASNGLFCTSGAASSLVPRCRRVQHRRSHWCHMRDASPGHLPPCLRQRCWWSRRSGLNSWTHSPASMLSSTCDSWTALPSRSSEVTQRPSIAPGMLCSVVGHHGYRYVIQPTSHMFGMFVFRLRHTSIPNILLT
jgi:hypothetical protein